MTVERTAAGALGEVVETYWQLRGKGGTGESPLEILPDAHFALGFGISERNCRILAGGPSTRALQLSVTDARDFFFIRFRPGRLPSLLGLRPADLVDQTELDLPSVLGRSADEWGECLRAARSLEARREILEAALRGVRLDFLCQDRRCTQAIARVEGTHGRITVMELARDMGLSTRTLERIFLEQVGLAPKRFIRNLRFQHALDHLRRRPAGVSLGRIAYGCGYADQTHFINDIKELSGRLPSAF
jgi:AraC-like DNA-binding protein